MKIKEHVALILYSYLPGFTRCRCVCFIHGMDIFDFYITAILLASLKALSSKNSNHLRKHIV